MSNAIEDVSESRETIGTEGALATRSDNAVSDSFYRICVSAGHVK